MLLGSSEVGMNKAGTTAKTSRNNVLILTEAPCLCASSTLAKFQVFAVASFCCGTHMGVGILGSEYWGLNTGVGVTGVGCYLGSAVTGVGCHAGVGLTGVSHLLYRAQPPPSPPTSGGEGGGGHQPLVAHTC